jgi:hypothetical protein
LAYQPPASSIFLSEQTSHKQPASSTFLSEQISTSHQPPAKRTGSMSADLCHFLKYAAQGGTSVCRVGFKAVSTEAAPRLRVPAPLASNNFPRGEEHIRGLCKV